MPLIISALCVDNCGCKDTLHIQGFAVYYIDCQIIGVVIWTLICFEDANFPARRNADIYCLIFFKEGVTMPIHTTIIAVSLAFLSLAAFTVLPEGAFFCERAYASMPAPGQKGASDIAPATEQMKLPAPTLEGGMPLMQALSLRKSTRSFSKEELSMQQLSDILWAAFGQNRPDGRRTIPTAMNRQNMVVYVALQSGVWRYLPESNELVKESGEDVTSSLGGAPCTLGYAVEGKFGAMHAGSSYQNVGLYCASSGLANVVKATGVDILKGQVKLPSGFDIVIIQSVGKQ